jgi:serine/threonine protein kinase
MATAMDPGTASSSTSSRPAPHGRVLGRYLIFGEIGAGGSATVHFGRLRGPAGFGRTVALKRLHGHLANDPKHVSQFLAEARLTARIHHPNVVPLLDVIALPDGELLLVMDYVHGETLGGLLGAARRRQLPVPLSVTSAVITGALLGLHAAHETASETGMPLGLVHGDVSPHNVIVGADGSARVLDFGIARVAGTTIDKRRVMGTPAYMAPERFRDAHFDRRSDLFGAAVVLWEMLTLDRLFKGQSDPPSAERAVRPIDPPSSRNPAVPPALDAVVLKALKARPEDRYPTALAFARALETAVAPATSREVAEWVTEICGLRLRERAAELSRIEAVTAPELVSSNDLRQDRTGDEDALSFSVLDLGEPPLPGSGRNDSNRFRTGSTRLGLPTQAPRSRLPAVPADDEPTAIEPHIDPRLLEAMRPDAADLSPPALRLVTPDLDEAPTTIEASTAAVTSIADRRHLPMPVAPSPASLVLAPPSMGHPMQPLSGTTPPAPSLDRPSLDRALQERGREVTPNFGRTGTRATPSRSMLNQAGADLGAIEPAVHHTPAPTRRDSSAFAVAGDVAELLRASRAPRLAAMGVMAAVTVIAVLLGLRASLTRPAPVATPVVVVAPPPAAPVAPTAPAPAAAAAANAATAVATRAEPAPQPSFRMVPPTPEAAAPAAEAEPVRAAATPEPEPEPEVVVVASETPKVRVRTARSPARRSAAVPRGLVALNRQAMAAYERLDLNEAQALLRRGLQEGSGNRAQLALTHVNLGVVLAGGFKQPGLAVKHFRLARMLSPNAAPPPRLITPEVGVAFREAAASLLAARM